MARVAPAPIPHGPRGFVLPLRRTFIALGASLAIALSLALATGGHALDLVRWGLPIGLMATCYLPVWVSGAPRLNDNPLIWMKEFSIRCALPIGVWIWSGEGTAGAVFAAALMAAGLGAVAGLVAYLAEMRVDRRFPAWQAVLWRRSFRRRRRARSRAGP